MNFDSFIPGKTFVVGEYLALHAGPTVLALTEPCFQLSVRSGSGNYGVIHPESPAGLFVKKHQSYFGSVDLDFTDPYSGIGGFGASTAQFLGVYAYRYDNQLNRESLLQEYLEVAWSGVGTPPSGADLIAQLNGQLSFFEKKTGQLETLTWNFEDVDFCLIHTGNKVPTHEHLKTLGDFDSSGLERNARVVLEGLQTKVSDLFVAGIQGYADALLKLNFTCGPTIELLTTIREINGVLAAKGCGALGADVIFVVTKHGQSQGLRDFCRDRHLRVIASHNELSAGLKVVPKELS